MKIMFTLGIAFSLIFMLVSCKGGNDVDIKVTSIMRVVDQNHPGDEICGSFILTQEDVVTYFTLSEEVDAYRFNQEAVILPCKYEGTVNIHGEVLRWEISAGGAGYLYDESGRVNKRYLCGKSCCGDLPNIC